MTLIGLLVVLLVFCLVYWAATSLMSAFQVGDPIRTVVIVILVILLVIWLAGQLGLMPLRIR
jgi:hypothetical protein